MVCSFYGAYVQVVRLATLARYGATAGAAAGLRASTAVPPVVHHRLTAQREKRSQRRCGCLLRAENKDGRKVAALYGPLLGVRRGRHVHNVHGLQRAGAVWYDRPRARRVSARLGHTLPGLERGWRGRRQGWRSLDVSLHVDESSKRPF